MQYRPLETGRGIGNPDCKDTARGRGPRNVARIGVEVNVAMGVNHPNCHLIAAARRSCALPLVLSSSATSPYPRLNIAPTSSREGTGDARYASLSKTSLDRGRRRKSIIA